MLAGPRYLYALAETGTLPAAFARIHPRYRTPHIAILTQTRVAAVRYTLVADEFLIWDEAARDDDLIVQYLASSEKVGIDTELELIRSRARAMASHINRDLSFANLQASVARLYNSVGYDAVDVHRQAGAIAASTGEASFDVETRLIRNELGRPDCFPVEPTRCPGCGETAMWAPIEPLDERTARALEASRRMQQESETRPPSLSTKPP